MIYALVVLVVLCLLISAASLWFVAQTFIAIGFILRRGRLVQDKLDFLQTAILDWHATHEQGIRDLEDEEGVKAKLNIQS